jgi:hypothetical protein
VRRFPFFRGCAPLVVALAVSACDDPFFGAFDPIIATDTIELQAPILAQAQLPSALDVTAVGGFIHGGRFPERSEDAGAWDFAVSLRDGALVLVPPAAYGFDSRAGLTPPIQGVTFEGLHDVPAGARFVTDSTLVVEPGAIYVVRSREFAGGFGAGCLQYAKVQALEADAATGTLRVQVATNERCFDTRLVPAS